MYAQLGSPPLHPAAYKLKGPNGADLKVRGQFTCKLEGSRSRKVKETVFVVEDLFTPLLGQPAIEALGLIQRIALIQGKIQLHDIMQEFPKLFTGLGKLEGEYSIKLNDDTEPFALNAPHRVPVPLMTAVKEELERM